MGSDEGDEEEGHESKQDREGQNEEGDGSSWEQGEDFWRPDEGRPRQEQERPHRREEGFGGSEKEVRRQQDSGMVESMSEGQEGTQHQGFRPLRRQDGGWQGLVCQSQGHLQRLRSACRSGTALRSPSVVQVPRTRGQSTLVS